MSSNYPTSVDNTPDLQDGVDYIEADDVNTPKDSAEAAQSFLGASGAAQSHNTDLLAHIVAIRPTIKLSYTDVDEITASAGLSRPQNAAGSVRKLRKNTSTTSITGANLDAGGPAFAASTTYYVYSDGDAAATTVAFVVSTNASAPAAVTNYELIGGFATDGSGNIVSSTVWSAAGLEVVQVQEYSTGEEAHGSGTIANDDTIPQKTEGNQVLTLSFQPAYADSKIHVEVLVHGASQVDGSFVVAALFFDTESDARAVGYQYQTYGTNPATRQIYIPYWLSLSAASVIAMAVRAGGTSGTFTLNGQSSARKYGGKLISNIRVTEYR